MVIDELHGVSEMGIPTDGIRIYLDSFPIRLYGLVDSSTAHQRVSKIRMGCRVIVVKLDYSLEAFYGFFNFLAVKER